jgi:hypothetical protein
MIKGRFEFEAADFYPTDKLMARHNLREVVLMVLTVFVGVGILLLIGNSLTHLTASSIAHGSNGGVAFSVSRFSVNLFAMLIMGVVAILVVLAVWLKQR